MADGLFYNNYLYFSFRSGVNDDKDNKEEEVR